MSNSSFLETIKAFSIASCERGDVKRNGLKLLKNKIASMN